MPLAVRIVAIMCVVLSSPLLSLAQSTLTPPDGRKRVTAIRTAAAIHRPLSDFFVGYNESQFTDGLQTAGRGIVVKYTQLFSF